MIADTAIATFSVRQARRRSARAVGPRINLYAVAGLAISAGLWGGIVMVARALLGA